MAIFSYFCMATENIFLISDKTLRSTHEIKIDGELPSFRLKFQKIRQTEGWEKRIAYPPFVEEFSRRKEEFEKSLKKAHQIARMIFIDSPFLRSVAHLANDEFLRATIVICSDILKVRARERQSWIQYISYLTLTLAPPKNLDLKKVGLDAYTVRDFPRLKLSFFNKTEAAEEKTATLLDEFHESPWRNFEYTFDGVFGYCTGRQVFQSDRPSEDPKAFLDTYSLLGSRPGLNLAVEKGATDKLLKKLSHADEIPVLVKEFLKRFPEFQPKPKNPSRGRPSTFRLAWMRRAAKKGYKWKEFHRFYQDTPLDLEAKGSLDEDIRRALYKK